MSIANENHPTTHGDELMNAPYGETLEAVVVDVQPQEESAPPVNPERAPRRSRVKTVIAAGTAAVALVAGVFVATSRNEEQQRSNSQTALDRESSRVDSDNPEMDALRELADQSAVDAAREAEAQQSALAEMSRATPRFVPYDTGDHLYPDDTAIETLFWNIQMGILKNDDAFIQAALGDEMERGDGTLPAMYDEIQRSVAERNRIVNLTPYNFYVGPRRDVVDAIVQDSDRPWIFTVQVEVQIQDSISYKTQRITLNESYSAMAGHDTWNIDLIQDLS